MNNLILAAEEKSEELGARDIQVIYHLVQSDSVEGMGTEANPFKINRVGYNGRGGGVGGSGRGLGMTDYQAQSGGGRGLFNKPEAPLAPAIRVTAADAQGNVDTSATNHVSGCLHLLSNLCKLRQNILLNLASLDGSVMATHVGSIRLPSKHSTIKLDNALYCPSVHGTLISLGQLLDDDFIISFDNHSMVFTAPVLGDKVVASLSGRSWMVPILSES
ncbi:uncharacterized protein VP01_1390g2, partial [Puccinia sorghi]